MERAERTGIIIKEKTVKVGPFRTTVGGRANLMIFLSIIIIVAMLGISGRFFGQRGGFSLGGNSLAVSLSRESRLLALNLVKTAPKRGEVYLGEVDISVIPVGADEALEPFSSRITFNPLESETYTIILPFGIDEAESFFVSFRSAFEQKSLRISAQK
jgi:hypothetical protein